MKRLKIINQIILLVILVFTIALKPTLIAFADITNESNEYGPAYATGTTMADIQNVDNMASYIIEREPNSTVRSAFVSIVNAYCFPETRENVQSYDKVLSIPGTPDAYDICPFARIFDSDNVLCNKKSAGLDLYVNPQTSEQAAVNISDLTTLYNICVTARAETAGMTEDEKINYVFTTVKQHIPHKTNLAETPSAGKMMYAIKNDYGVCHAYANLAYFIGINAGLNIRSVVGETLRGEKHLWNKVKKADGREVVVDTYNYSQPITQDEANQVMSEHVKTSDFMTNRSYFYKV